MFHAVWSPPPRLLLLRALGGQLINIQVLSLHPCRYSSRPSERQPNKTPNLSGRVWPPVTFLTGLNSQRELVHQKVMTLSKWKRNAQRCRGRVGDQLLGFRAAHPDSHTGAFSRFPHTEVQKRDTSSSSRLQFCRPVKFTEPPLQIPDGLFCKKQS